MREITVERALVRSVKSMGGLALKFVSPGMAGVPDRLVLLPGGRIAFVELKAPGRKPRPLQLLRHEQLRNLGFRVYVIDSAEQIRAFVREMEKGRSLRARGYMCPTVEGRPENNDTELHGPCQQNVYSDKGRSSNEVSAP